MTVAHKLTVDANKAAKALWIHERFHILTENQLVKHNESLLNLKKWRERKNIVSDQSFNIKLEYEKYSEEDFDYIIGPLEPEVFEKLATYVEHSNWFKVLNKSIELLEKESNRVPIGANLGPAIKPFLLWCNQKLTNFFDSLNDELFMDKKVIVDKLVELIASELIDLVSRSAVLELHISKLEGKLLGDSPEERFKSFIDYQFIDKNYLIHFYEEYIVLARLLTTRCMYFVDNLIEAVTHFIQDHPELLNYMNLGSSKATEIKPGMGDTHQKGHTVISFKFDNNKMIFYKPKNLFIAEAYNHLIHWINEKNELLDMSTYKILCRDSYTWEEAVVKQNCLNYSQIEKFYERFGQLIGIMYCLRGGDFHFENLIANGEYPCIIDLETIFQHTPPMVFQDSANVEAKMEYMNSVMWLGLLPHRVYNGINDRTGIDMSALNGKEQKASFKILQPHNNYTDDMIYDYAEFFLSNKDNLPSLNEESVHLDQFKDYIYRGFQNSCLFFIKHKEEIIHNEELLPSFKDKYVRIILRATKNYAMMLQEGTHPDYLRNAIDREKLLDNLWSYPFPDKHVISHEVKDMLDGDIPIFFTMPQSRDLIDSNGRLIRNFFEKSSYDIVVERLRTLTISEIEKQLSWVKVSLGDYQFSNSKKTKSYDYIPFSEMNSQILVKEACKIGDDLLDQAVYSKDNQTITWLDVIIDRSNLYSIDCLPTDFYDGLGGLLLFYYQLFRITKMKKYKNVYQKLLKTIKYIPDMGIVSSHYGNLSILQALSRIPDHDKELQNLMLEQLKLLEEKMEDFDCTDYLSGYAGFINCLLSIHENNEDQNNAYLLKLIEKLAEKLAEKLSENKLKDIPGGMAHGASGLSLILFKLHHLLHKKEYKDLATQLLEIDRSYFDSDVQGWKEAETGAYLHQWCHGSTGIGISRALMMNLYNDPLLNKEIELAVKNVLKNSYKLEDSLCHGNMGDVELFITLSIVLKENKYREYAFKILNQMLWEKDRNGTYYIRNVEGFTGIGLFTGRAGIGYEMLRAAEPALVPSVLY